MRSSVCRKYFPSACAWLTGPRTRRASCCWAAPRPVLMRAKLRDPRRAHHLLRTSGFTLDEVGMRNHERLWLQGGFPRSYLASSAARSHEWRRAFIQTSWNATCRNWAWPWRSNAAPLLDHAGPLSWSSLERLGVRPLRSAWPIRPCRHYVDLLASALVVRLLLPWHENVGKRQVKAPKIYIADSGILHALLNLRTLSGSTCAPQVRSVVGGLRAFSRSSTVWARSPKSASSGRRITEPSWICGRQRITAPGL